MRGRRRMDEGATPPPGARPSLTRSHTGQSSNADEGDISLDHSLQDVSLDGGDAEEVLQDIGLNSPTPQSQGRGPAGPPSPSLRRNGRPPMLDFGDEDDGGDIGSAFSPPETKAGPTALDEEEGGDIGSALSPFAEESSHIRDGDEDEGGDIGSAPSPTKPQLDAFALQLSDERLDGRSRSPSPRVDQWRAGPSSPGRRSLTPSPSRRSQSSSRPPNRLQSPAQPIESHASLSPPGTPHTPLSGSRTPQSPSRTPSPPATHDFVSLKPHLPSSIPIPTGDEPINMAFESISLSITPPKPSISVPLPSSPRGDLNAHFGKEGKRRSWNGFGQANGDKASKRASWLNGAPASNGDVFATAKKGNSQPDIHEEVPEPAINDQAEASVPKPRLHAPPAHPHPFPLPPPRPSSPLSVANKRLSVPPEAAAPPIAGPSGGIGAKGLSAFEKIVNHTRPSHLPPKPKDEDDTHYHQWESMMAQAREHEKERRKVAEARRLDKEKKLAAATPRWDALLSDPGFSVGKVKSDQGLREMWFQGVPGYLRGKAWGLAIGNPLAMSKDAYKTYLSRARKALDSGRFPDAILQHIESDLDRTLPQLKLFGQSSPMRADLHEFLAAWVVYRSDEGLGYAPYVSHIAAMLLLPSPPAQAFLQLCNLLSRPCLHAFVTDTKDEIEAFYRVFENLQADTFPKIYANCSNLGLRLPEGYFRNMLVEQVPFEACCRLWDQIVLDGDGYIFRSALAIFGFLEPRLHYPDKNEILSVLEGRNKATLAITEREKERARLKGESFDDELDGKLSVFGLNEDALFDWLATDGWRESRYERLVIREMPD